MNIKSISQNFNFERLAIHRSFIMGVAILSIMFYHQRFIDPKVHFFLYPFYKIGYWGVDVFFFLSGMGITYSLEKHNLQTFYMRRIKRLLPSCLIVGVLKSLIIVEIIQGKFSWFSIFSMDLWFLRTLILYYIASPIIYKAVKLDPLKTLILSFLGSAIFAIAGDHILKVVFHVENRHAISYTAIVWSFWRFPAYVTGMILAHKGILTWTKNLIINTYTVCVVCLFGELAFILIDYLYKIPKTLGIISVVTFFLLVPAIPAVIDCFCWIGSFIPKVIHNSISAIGTNSLELYLIHEFVFFLTISYCGLGWLQLAIAFVISFVFAYLTKYLSAIIVRLVSEGDFIFIARL